MASKYRIQKSTLNHNYYQLIHKIKLVTTMGGYKKPIIDLHNFYNGFGRHFDVLYVSEDFIEMKSGLVTFKIMAK